MTIQNIENILALLDVHAFFPKCENITVTKEEGHFLKNTTGIEIPRSQNGGDSSDNAQ